jgi:hypothetical protein
MIIENIYYFADMGWSKNIVAGLPDRYYIRMFRGSTGICEGGETAPIKNLPPGFLMLQAGRFRQRVRAVLFFEILSRA